MVLLTKEKNEEVLARSKELIFESGDEKWRAEALSLAVTVAGRYFPKDFLLKFFKEEMKMLREASIVQDWINEGIEKGIEKGKKSGKLEVLQEDILDILEERFGIIKKGISRKLELIDDPAVLKSLHKKSIKVASLDEFAKILDEVLEEE